MINRIQRKNSLNESLGLYQLDSSLFQNLSIFCVRPVSKHITARSSVEFENDDGNIVLGASCYGLLHDVLCDRLCRNVLVTESNSLLV